MRPFITSLDSTLNPEDVVRHLTGTQGLVLLRSHGFDSSQSRYSLLAANPFMVFRSWGSRCETLVDGHTHAQFGNPWRLLDSLMSRFELLDDPGFPLPLGGCFGFWGYDLKNFVEPTLPRRAFNDLGLPDCVVGFYDSLAVFDHRSGENFLVCTGLGPDGARTETRARRQRDFWQAQGVRAEQRSPTDPCPLPSHPAARPPVESLFADLLSNPSAYISRIHRIQDYIRQGHIYQVNLCHRLRAESASDPWQLYQALSAVSPAPFSAYLHCEDFQLISSSPELFLRISGSHIQTRPIKGTRPRSLDPIRDAQLASELRTSPKEMAELIMITDLLRNDFGKICEFGSVTVPELLRLETYPQVHHLVSTVEGCLRPGVSHFAALAACFPGGSITGAPKFRAMQIIDELEPLARGPYTGALGYLGFNRESQLSIAIRTAIQSRDNVYFHVGAGIVADSNPMAEYEETLAKAAGFFAALAALPCAGPRSSPHIPTRVPLGPGSK